MTSATEPPYRPKLLGWVGAYILFYGLSSLADLWSTLVALRHVHVSEANTFASCEDGSLDIAKALWITLEGGLALLAMFVFALARAEAVSAEYLQHPTRAFLRFRGLINPFGRSASAYMPVQFLALALALPLLRFLAAGNNLMLAADYTGPLSLIVKRIGEVTNPTVGFLSLMPLFYLMGMAVAPLAAQLLGQLRGSNGSR